jgi:hypothetical protein
MTTTTRTSHRQGARSAAIQPPILTGAMHRSRLRILPRDLKQAAQSVLNRAQREAYELGKHDAETGFRDHPPYGFSDLKQAWRLGWLAGKQKKEGLNGGSLQGDGSVVRSSAVENGK